MITALILIAIGLILALAVPHIVAHVIGWIFIAIGVILLVFAFLPADADARSSWSLLLFGPHMARVLRWAAQKLDPQQDAYNMNGTGYYTTTYATTPIDMTDGPVEDWISDFKRPYN
jgi:cell division protein FtsW (lipid II flippase)